MGKKDATTGRILSQFTDRNRLKEKDGMQRTFSRIKEAKTCTVPM